MTVDEYMLWLEQDDRFEDVNIGTLYTQFSNWYREGLFQRRVCNYVRPRGGITNVYEYLFNAEHRT